MRLLQGLKVLLGALVFFCTLASDGRAAPSAIHRIEESLAVIGHLNAAGDAWTDFGTGFCIASDGSSSRFITDFHVVDPSAHDGNTIYVLLPGSDKPVEGTLAVPGKNANAAQIADAKYLDLAVVSVNVGKIPKLDFSTSVPDPDTKIELFGYAEISNQPLFLRDAVAAPFLYHGSVSSVAVTQIFYDVQEGGHLVDQGTSGAPVFDAQSGEIYGVQWQVQSHTLRNNPDAPSIGESTSNVATSLKAVNDFINGRAVAMATSPAEGMSTLNTSASADPNARLRASAALGNADAQNTLGLDYLDGSNGIVQDPAQAMRYFELAAAQGNANGISNLGWMYDNGLGVTKNPVIAASYYARAAAKGNSTAENNLATLYWTGRGVPHDLQRAFEYYRKAAAQDDSTAEYNLGSMYLLDRTHKNLKLAFDYLKRASGQGDASSDVNLGVMYETGMFVRKDAAEAARYYKLAADHGDSRGQADLALYYVSLKNYSDALKYLQLSSAQHDPLGDLYLGDMHAKGYGVPKDQSAARSYYVRAVADYAKALPDDRYNPANYRSRGRAYLALGENKNAMADFTEAIRLDPSAYSYRALGFMQFNVGDFTDAARNLRIAGRLDTSYPYVILWMHLADARISVDDTHEFAKKIASLGAKKWPSPAVQLFLGKNTVAHMMASASNSDERCEATFYNAEYDLLKHDKRGARALFTRAVATCPGTFIEYFAARGELSRL